MTWESALIRILFDPFRTTTLGVLILSIACADLIGCGAQHQPPPVQPAANTSAQTASNPEINRTPSVAGSDEEQLRQELEQLAAAWNSKHLEAALSSCSEEFRGPLGESKADWVKECATMIDMATIEVRDATYSVAGAEASAFPVTSYLTNGTKVTQTFLFKKEGNLWKWSGILLKSPDNGSQPVAAALSEDDSELPDVPDAFDPGETVRNPQY